MKKATKVVLVICAALASLGLILLGVGTAMGARPYQYMGLIHEGTREIRDELDFYEYYDHSYVDPDDHRVYADPDGGNYVRPYDDDEVYVFPGEDGNNVYPGASSEAGGGNPDNDRAGGKMELSCGSGSINVDFLK